MTAPYKIRELQIPVEGGAMVIIEVGSLDGVRAALEAFSESGLAVAAPIRPPAPPTPATPSTEDNGDDGESPEARIAQQIGATTADVTKAGLLGFKNSTPQILKPQDHSVTDALVLLLYAMEVGQGTTKVAYEDFKELYEAQNIKSNSPLSMRITDLRNGGYVDKKIYKQDRSLSLTAKGQKKAVEYIKGHLPK